MKIGNDILKSSLQHLTSIPCGPEPLEAQMDDIFDGLHQMLDAIRTQLTNRDIYYFTYRLDRLPKGVGIWRAIKRALLMEGKRGSTIKDLPPEIDPWSEEIIQFWTLVGAKPQFHDLAKNWLANAESLLAQAVNIPARYDLWEYDEVQFAEPAIATLALSDVSFVPYYTKLLGLWDMEHEVTQRETIKAIFDKYGVCPETEDLMICRMDKGFGQWGDDNMEHFYPALEAHYGDLTQSDFLRRMVLQSHKSAVAQYEKDIAHATKNLVQRRKTQPAAKMPDIPQPVLGYLAYDKNLSKTAQRIFDVLENERLS